jgi:hypothetical protein
MPDYDVPAKTSIRVEFDGELTRQLEDWRRRQPVIPTGAEAVRHHMARSLASDSAASAMASA